MFTLGEFIDRNNKDTIMLYIPKDNGGYQYNEYAPKDIPQDLYNNKVRYIDYFRGEWFVYINK